MPDGRRESMPECPGSRRYIRGGGGTDPEVVERRGEFNTPTRARCPECGRVVAVVGPGTYRHLRKHRIAT